ncbi:MAG: hypothetical protein RBR42_11550 [Desulfomicrobium sp.]|nr:hypothetical protein [Desulfomicrobium sp.]
MRTCIFITSTMESKENIGRYVLTLELDGDCSAQASSCSASFICWVAR